MRTKFKGAEVHVYLFFIIKILFLFAASPFQLATLVADLFHSDTSFVRFNNTHDHCGVGSTIYFTLFASHFIFRSRYDYCRWACIVFHI